MQRTALLSRTIIPGAVIALLALGGCDDNPTDSGDEPHVHDHDVHAWLWAFDDDGRTVTVYDTHDGVAETTYTAAAFPMMHCFTAGPSLEPTLWMAKGNTAYAFTAGFDLSHGDHAHMETPLPYASIAVGNSPVHMGRSPSGDTVAFANDDDGTVSIIDVGSKSVVGTVSHGSGHSAALLIGDRIITTAATGSGATWAKIVDIATDSVLDSLTIGAGAHGDAYHAAGSKAFIACADGMYIIDAAARRVTGSIPYGEPGRTNFLYHSHANDVAIGLHKTDGGTSDKLLLLDMRNETLEYLQITGATLTWNIRDGHFALSDDGNTAVIADMQTAAIYHVDLPTKTVTTLQAPAAGCAVAVDAGGETVWALNDGTVTTIDAAENHTVDTVSVSSDTDWLFVTSVTVDVTH
jgi:DNA-binding beta-propeller fold protein YncE